jgi:predicted pyridoxine 5'-phosphate oxidase superfamily flavin-nucleotide-binding protein
MSSRYLNQLFTPSVKAAQEANGSRQAYARAIGPAGESDLLTPREQMFISMRDSFYMATNSASGWPYLQHRGGSVGFIKVLDERTLGFAEFRGNRQYVSLGNLADDNRASLFFMDYVRRARLKVLGRIRAVELADHSDLAAALIDQDYGAKVERGLIFEIDSYDWNCPQHITPRYTEDQVEQVVEPLKARIAELEATLARPCRVAAGHGYDVSVPGREEGLE